MRHVPPGPSWHPAADQLTGTESYGTPGGPTDSFAWSVQWADSDAGEFLFALGDCSKWLVAERDQVIGWYDNGMRTMMCSSNGATQARWYPSAELLECKVNKAEKF